MIWEPKLEHVDADLVGSKSRLNVFYPKQCDFVFCIGNRILLTNRGLRLFCERPRHIAVSLIVLFDPELIF